MDLVGEKKWGFLFLNKHTKFPLPKYLVGDLVGVGGRKGCGFNKVLK